MLNNVFTILCILTVLSTILGATATAQWPPLDPDRLVMLSEAEVDDTPQYFVDTEPGVPFPVYLHLFDLTLDGVDGFEVQIELPNGVTFVDVSFPHPGAVNFGSDNELFVGWPYPSYPDPETNSVLLAEVTLVAITEEPGAISFAPVTSFPPTFPGQIAYCLAPEVAPMSTCNELLGETVFGVNMDPGDVCEPIIIIPHNSTIIIETVPDGVMAPWRLHDLGWLTDYYGVGPAVLHDMCAESYELTWSQTDHWSADPQWQTGSVDEHDTLTFTTLFTPIGPGTIFVSPGPDDEPLPWTLEGPEFLRTGDNPAAFDPVPAGEYTLTYEPYDGYFPPPENPETQVLSGNGAIAFDGWYEPWCSIAIDSSPDQIAAPWTLSSSDTSFVPVSGEGDTLLTAIRPGNYSLEWLPVESWPVVPDAIVSEHVDSGEKLRLVGQYGRSDCVIVDVAPVDLPAPPDTTVWALVGPDGFSASGNTSQVFLDMDPGLYTLTWTDIVNWQDPESLAQQQTLTQGDFIAFQETYEEILPDFRITGTGLNGVGFCQTSEPDSMNRVYIDYQLDWETDYVGEMNVAAYLTLDEYVGDDDDIRIAHEATSRTWTPGSAYRDTMIYFIDASVPRGDYYLYYTIDDGDLIDEQDEDNNVHDDFGPHTIHVMSAPGTPPTLDINEDHPLPHHHFTLDWEWDWEGETRWYQVWENGESIHYCEDDSSYLMLQRPPGTYWYQLRAGNLCGWSPLSESLMVYIPSYENSVVVYPHPDEIAAGWQLQGPDQLELAGTGFHVLEDAQAGEYHIVWSNLPDHQETEPLTTSGMLVADSLLVFEQWYLEPIAVPDHSPLPTRVEIASTYPNPFNPTTTIMFALPAETKVNLSIYDLRGRLVRQLVMNESLSAGTHEVIWNGRSTRGKPVSSGVYFCLLQTEEARDVSRMTLLK